jgi:hypothetical protein
MEVNEIGNLFPVHGSPAVLDRSETCIAGSISLEGSISCSCLSVKAQSC